MCCLATTIGRPVLALPIDEMRRRRFRHPFPPDVAIVGQGHVGENHIRLEHLHRIRIRLARRAWRHAKIAGLGIDRVEHAVRVRLDPRDVVADGRHLPALEALRRNQHREVGLAARAWKRSSDVGLFAARRCHAENQHVLGEPALVAPHHRCDPQCEAFLAEQRVAAVARAIAPYLARFGKMHDIFVLAIARPACVFCTGRQRGADRMNAGHERRIGAEHGENRAAHPRHEPHVGDNIRTVRDLDPDVRNGAADRSHRERDDVHRAAAHRAVEEAAQRLAHVGRRDPVVGRPGILFALAADERAVLDPRHVRRIRPR